jgi:hypothetical protein
MQYNRQYDRQYNRQLKYWLVLEPRLVQGLQYSRQYNIGITTLQHNMIFQEVRL